MKIIFAILFLFTVCWDVRAFTIDEIREAACSIPVKYSRRYIQCIYDEGPEFYRLFADVWHFCIQHFHNTTELTESMLYLMCEFDPDRDGNTSMCYYAGIKDMGLEGDPRQDEEKFMNTLKNCLFSAK